VITPLSVQVWHAFSMDLTVLPADPAFIRWRNEPYLPLPSQPKLVLIYRPRRDGRLSWPWVAGWLHTEISVRHPIRSSISVLTGSDVD